MARWFYASGDVWLNGSNEFECGGMLIYSKQNPEGTITTTDGEQTTSGRYFANVYHVAFYYGKDAGGNDLIIDSYGVASGAGVTAHRLSEVTQNDIMLVARPDYQRRDN